MANLDRGIVFRELDRLFSEGTLAGLGDSQLLERYLTRRDEAAFEALVNLHGPMVLGLCRRILRDPRDIEDAFQATFLVLVRKASGIRDRGLLSNWLYGVALKVATRARASALRRRGREAPMNGLEASARPESTDHSGIGQVLDQELSRLPVKYRVPLVMCYLRGQTHDQAAAELSWPVGTVRSRMARGRELLKQRLTRRGFLSSATILGPGPALPTQLFSEVVPQSLVAATVEGAFAIGSSQTIQAGTAASVLALTQGVLTTMKLTQLKWIGLALLTTTVSTGGAIVIASARSQSSTGAETLITADAGPGGGTSQDPSGTATTKTVRRGGRGSSEDRIKAMNVKINELYKLSGMGDRAPLPDLGPESSPLDHLEAMVDFFWSMHAGAATSQVDGDTPKRAEDSARPRDAVDDPVAQTTSATTVAEQAKTQAASTTRTGPAGFGRRRGTFGGMAKGAARTESASATDQATTTSTSSATGGEAVQGMTAQLDAEPRRVGSNYGREIRELESQLKVALLEYANTEKLHAQSVVSANEVALYHSKVSRAIGILGGMDEDLREELDNLRLEVKKKTALLEQAHADRDALAAVAARNQQLNERKPGMVADTDVAKGRAELGSAEAQVRVKGVELEETALRIQQVEQRRARIGKIVKWATDSATHSHSTMRSAEEPKQ